MKKVSVILYVLLIIVVIASVFIGPRIIGNIQDNKKKNKINGAVEKYVKDWGKKRGFTVFVANSKTIDFVIIKMKYIDSIRLRNAKGCSDFFFSQSFESLDSAYACFLGVFKNKKEESFRLKKIISFFSEAISLRDSAKKYALRECEIEKDMEKRKEDDVYKARVFLNMNIIRPDKTERICDTVFMFLDKNFKVIDNF